MSAECADHRFSHEIHSRKVNYADAAGQSGAEAAAAGRTEEAEAKSKQSFELYGEVLAEYPNSVEVMLGKARVFVWLKICANFSPVFLAGLSQNSQ